jgi:DNA-binding beta-propeller fold protein YncE
MRTLLLPVSALLLASSCAENSLVTSNDSDRGAWDTAGPEGDADADADADTEPEEEDDFLALRPAQTDIFVFIANPGRNTVTRVNVQTLEVRTTPVGVDPRVVITTPDYATAAVFNRGDDSVTILDANTLEARTVGVRDDFNRMVMSPDGRWVALWHDLSAERPDDPEPEGVQSFNEVSFVDLTTAAHHPMAVDYNPREIKFTPDSTLAAVVTDTSLGLVDLTATALSPRLVRLTEELVDPPVAEEVAIAPDGTWAFVRQFGAEDLAVVDLLGGTVARVPVGLNPTDLDLTPDGRRAVVVARGSHELYLFDLADPFAAPDVLGLPTEVNLGSVLIDPTGQKAVVYTTAAPVDRYATWDLASGEITLRSLVKPVETMAVTPTGESLLVFHTKEDAADADSSSPFYGKWALTLIALSDFRQNPLALPAEPIGYSNSNNGRFGYFIMDGQKYLEVLDYRTLLPEEIELRSDPVYVGVLPDLFPDDDDEPVAWASQEHELGRISFYDPDDGAVETITGFELNSEIEE